MRLQATVGLLAVLVFGVGWTSRAVLDGDPAVLASTGTCGSCRGHSHSSPGPYLSTVDKLREDLQLTTRQHEELQFLIQSTSEQVARNDQARREIYRESGDRVRALLTDEQLARLSCIVADRMDQYRWQRVLAAEEFGRETELEPDTARQVVDAQAEYEQAKIDLYTKAFARTEEVDGEDGGDCGEAWSRAHDRYQERLDALLSGDQRAGLRAALLRTCETSPATISQ